MWFKDAVARYVRQNVTDLLNLDLKVARLLGIPAPWTLSAYAYIKHGFWEKVINRIFLYFFNEQDHCHQDYIRITTIKT